MKSVRPFLMFQGKAEEAIAFYAGLFTDCRIVGMTRVAKGEPGVEGSLKRGTIALKDQVVDVFDSPVKHDFTFTPAFSFFVECESDAELTELAAALSENGATFMPLGAYGFSKKFAWVGDRFGVSWQLNLD
jgi:predicted 3-demethylubiquinone-9 3-methyltransferase (glyoxalase superfamily)